MWYVFQGASLWSFARQQHLKLKTRGSSTQRRMSKLRITSEAVYVLGSLLFLSNSAALVDNWFHLSSSSFMTTSSSHYPLSNETLFGRQVDDFRCSEYASLVPTGWINVTEVRQLCGVITDEGVASPNAIAEAQQMWTNISTPNRIAMTQDQHAILVPSNLPEDVRYLATTVGVKATCERYALQ